MEVVRTKRLHLVPLNAEEMKALTNRAQTDTHMQAAIHEMYTGCITHPNDWYWYTNWQIKLCSEGTSIGSLCFKGPPVHGAVEIGYGIDPPYQKQGYATEAVKAVTEWAFTQQGVCYVTAETEKENRASIRVLENCEFTNIGKGVEGLRWKKEKPASH